MYKYIKRFFDFIFALIMVIAVTPFMLPIVIGLLLTGEHDIFYFQKRVGFKNKIFEIIKFATMLKNSPNMKGGAITTTRDPRILPMGGFLRKTKINELPQLLNVLKGDMSFVGPRPVMKEASFDHYPKDVQKVIFNVKPGITGIGSIVFRDEEALITKVKEAGNDPMHFYTKIIYPYKGEIEKWYQANQSFFLDFSILICTAWVILFPKSDIIFKLFPGIPRKEKAYFEKYIHSKAS